MSGLFPQLDQILPLNPFNSDRIAGHPLFQESLFEDDPGNRLALPVNKEMRIKFPAWNNLLKDKTCPGLLKKFLKIIIDGDTPAGPPIPVIKMCPVMLSSHSHRSEERRVG